jgi:WhiB family redox-sensing transcriptional regulator
MIVTSSALSTGSRPATADRVVDGSNWRQSSACLGEDPELFFPIGTSGPALRQAEEAKNICRQCPVVAQCLTWALETGVDHGVWGAQTEDERRALRRRRARPSRLGGWPR